jgi:hypothetical protein
MNPLPTATNAPTNGFQRGADAYSNTPTNWVPTSANGMCSNPPYTPGAVRRSAPSGLRPSGRSFRPPSRNDADICCRRAAP